MRIARAVVAALTLAAALSADAAEPLCEWLGGIGDAAQAQSEGRWSDAERGARRALAARPHGAAAARASAALGVALAQRGEPDEAAAALEVALAASTTPARPHLAFARGEALLASGDAPRAARVLAEAAAAEDLAVARRARLREADALLASGLAAEAVPLLRRILERAPDDAAAPAARLALATGLRALGDETQAQSTLRALWLDAAAPEARAAGEALAAWRRTGGPVPPATGDEHLLRAERLLADGRPEDAIGAVAAAADADPPPSRPELALALRAGALLASGRHADAERAAAPIADSADEPVRRAARFVLARAASRAGRLAEASARYAEVAASHAPIPGLPEWRQRDVGDEAAFLAAWLWYDAGEWASAAHALDAFAARNPRSRRVEDALWFAAWSRYRLGRAADASRAFGRLSRGTLADAAAYWQARLATGSARQRALYRTAATAGGDGWYGVLARARLAAAGTPVAPPARPVARALPEVPEPGASVPLAIAVELLSMGLAPAGLDELRALSRGSRARAAAPLVAQLAAFAGDAELPFRMARDHLAPTRRTLRWAHPEPYPELLPARARAFGVDASLVRAVIRRESSFRPEARSGAGAEGLLQLRPATAERLATVLGVPGGLPARLREPEVSLSLGAHYLGLLATRFRDPAAALAAYNAGPRAAAEWAGARAGMPLDAWVESIPYRETRQYVKIVLADRELYRELSGEAPSSLDPGHPVPAPGEGVAF